MEITAVVTSVSPETDYGRPVDVVTVEYDGVRSVWQTEPGKYTPDERVKATLVTGPGEQPEIRSAR